jgi:hypothetical protein
MVKIEKTGLFKYEYSGDLKKEVRTRVKKSRVWTELREACEIGEDVTLLDLFRVVSQYKALTVFLSQYSWCRHIEAYHAQAEEPTINASDSETELSYLEIFWATQYNSYKNKTWLDINSELHAFGPAPQTKDYGDLAGKIISWSVSCSSMAEIACLPIKLNTKVLFANHTTKGEPVLESTREFTLLEVLDAIYWDISWHGDPQQKNEFRDFLKESVENIQQDLLNEDDDEDD